MKAQKISLFPKLIDLQTLHLDLERLDKIKTYAHRPNVVIDASDRFSLNTKSETTTIVQGETTLDDQNGQSPSQFQVAEFIARNQIGNAVDVEQPFPVKLNSADEREFLTYDEYATLDRKSSAAARDMGYSKDGTWGNQGAGVLIVSSDHTKVLLLRRSGYVDDPGLWGIAGGASQETQKGCEPALVTAISEANEEMGSLPNGKLYEQAFEYKKPGTSFTYRTFVLEVDTQDFQPKLNLEHIDWQWFDIAGLDDAMVHPGVKVVLDGYMVKPEVSLGQDGKNRQVETPTPVAAAVEVVTSPPQSMAKRCDIATQLDGAKLRKDIVRGYRLPDEYRESYYMRRIEPYLDRPTFRHLRNPERFFRGVHLTIPELQKTMRHGFELSKVRWHTGGPPGISFSSSLYEAQNYIFQNGRSDIDGVGVLFEVKASPAIGPLEIGSFNPTGTIYRAPHDVAAEEIVNVFLWGQWGWESLSSILEKAAAGKITPHTDWTGQFGSSFSR